jgi:hypothetical protein
MTPSQGKTSDYESSNQSAQVIGEVDGKMRTWIGQHFFKNIITFFKKVTLKGDTIQIATAKTPATAAAAGNAGDICWDADYIYVCTATNTWKRSAIATW